MQMNYCKQPSMIVSHLTLNRLFRRTYPGMWASLVVQQRRICLQYRSCRFDPWIGEIPWRRKCQSTTVFLPGKFQGQKSLVGYSPWDHKASDMTEHTQCQHYTCSNIHFPDCCQFHSWNEVQCCRTFRVPWRVTFLSVTVHRK